MAHKTRSGRNSRAWVDLENKFAQLLREAGFSNAKRIIKETHDSRPDVDVPEVPEVAVDCKYSAKGFPQHTQFIKEVETYVGVRRKGEDRKYTWGVMPIRPKNSQDILVVLRAEIFIELLKASYLRENKSSSEWTCPRCPAPVTKKADLMGSTYHYACENCGLEFITNEVMGYKDRDIIRSNRSKSKPPVIKNNSKKAQPQEPTKEYTPMPGQLNITDVASRRKRKRNDSIII